MVRMAGLIVRKDIDLVRERTDLKAVVEEFVTLRSAGVGSFKGLCPFHDERTPSFHVRPGVGTYHCFGCGEHGDVISFLMELEHTTFTETVERLAVDQVASLTDSSAVRLHDRITGLSWRIGDKPLW